MKSVSSKKEFLPKQNNKLNTYNIIALSLAFFIIISVFLMIFLLPDVINNKPNSCLQNITEKL